MTKRTRFATNVAPTGLSTQRAQRPQGPAEEPPRPLSPTRAFVVQFRAAPVGAAPAFDGRVEHITSGRAARFESPEELLAFLGKELRAVEAAHREEPPAGRSE